MDKRDLITYCGLYCGHCAARTRIPNRARDLIKAMQIEGYDGWGKDLPGFKEFWDFANKLANVGEDHCCKSGKCGASWCGIRKCAQAKNLERCDACSEFPCDKIRMVAAGYPTLIFDAERRKKIGVEAWIEEQEKRMQTGFQYADIRCYPYDVPSD